MNPFISLLKEPGLDWDDVPEEPVEVTVETSRKEVTARAARTPASIERRARMGIRPGDTIVVTTHMRYEVGGPIIRRWRCEVLKARGPAWSTEDRLHADLERRMRGSLIPLDRDLYVETFGAVNLDAGDLADAVVAWEARTGRTVAGKEMLLARVARSRKAAQDAAEWAAVRTAAPGSTVSWRGRTFTRGENTTMPKRDITTLSASFTESVIPLTPEGTDEPELYRNLPTGAWSLRYAE